MLPCAKVGDEGNPKATNQMTILIALTLVCFAIALTVVAIGKYKGDSNLVTDGVLLTIAITFTMAAFQAGAQYQRHCTNESYLLIPKTK